MIEKPSPGLWTATFANPPINLIDPDTIGELHDLLSALEADTDVKVVVFRSADPDFFLAHWDVLADKAKIAAMPPGPTGMHPWIDVLVRLSRAPLASIAEIRGRARGAGSEFVLACDRFASRERAILGQFEVGMGAVPGGNPMARLAGLMGRGRGLEVILGADDFPADRPEQYGYVNRALPDEELEAFVDGFARRLSSFEKHALVGAKALMTKSRSRPTPCFSMRWGHSSNLRPTQARGARGIADQARAPNPVRYRVSTRTRAHQPKLIRCQAIKQH
jgi:enoyl-CoA hydratase/carnithine racemase